MGLFKTTGTFGVYVHAQLGSDITGNGSRNNPFATLTKAVSVYGFIRVLLAGSTIENAPGNTELTLGDTSTDSLLSVVGGPYRVFDNLSFKIIACSYYTKFTRCTIVKLKYSSLTQYTPIVYSCFINEIEVDNHGDTGNCSIINYNNNIGFTMRTIINSIIVSEINLYNLTSRANTTYYPIFKNCLFRKATLWKWNTTTIPINWTNNPVGGAAYDPEVTLMTRVYNSLLFYANSLGAGVDKTYFLAILATQDTMFKECVVWDDSDTVNNPIFSRYIDGVPVDYTLALKSNNPALYMSTTGSYVGCYAANVNDDGHGNHITFGAVKHVDTATGLDTTTAPDLLVQDPSNPAKFSASQSSLQLWNRIRTSVVEYPRGKSFAGMQSQLDSGIASRLFFGKRQEIRTTGDISQKTTAFESVEVIPYDSLPTPNTGAENTIDNMSTLLPRFSAPFNGECLIFYKAGVPLKFNDYNGLKTLFTGAGTVAITSDSAVVTGTSTTFTADFVKDDNIRIAGVDYKVLSIASNTSMTLTANVGVTLTAQTYQVGVTVDKSYTLYGNWAVTNADIESYSLVQKATKAGLTTSIPLIKWCKFELNLHYDEE